MLNETVNTSSFCNSKALSVIVSVPNVWNCITFHIKWTDGDVIIKTCCLIFIWLYLFLKGSENGIFNHVVFIHTATTSSFPTL
jgi:hypothetical protein